MLIPFRTDRPRIHRAYLTWTLIAVNTLVQIYSMALPPAQVPVSVGGRLLLAELPQLAADYGLWGSHPTLLTLFTHMFVHADLFHLAGNMLFLWLFGSLIEDAIRPWGLAAVYLGGGAMAAMAHIFISRALGAQVSGPMVGASGAIAAIMDNDNPDLPPAVQLKLARQLEAMRPQEAVALYRVAAERCPGGPEMETALLRLAVLHQQVLGQPLEAARYLDEFLRRFPGSSWAPQARQARAALEPQTRLG